MRRLAKAVMLVLLGAAPAPALATPVRTAAERQTLLDLAYVLGQAHALHRVCAGPQDDTWRGRMAKILDVEAAPDTWKARLTDSFNAGFGSPTAQAKDCRAAAEAEAVVAKRGAKLARSLAVTAPK